MEMKQPDSARYDRIPQSTISVENFFFVHLSSFHFMRLLYLMNASIQSIINRLLLRLVVTCTIQTTASNTTHPSTHLLIHILALQTPRLNTLRHTLRPLLRTSSHRSRRLPALPLRSSFF